MRIQSRHIPSGQVKSKASGPRLFRPILLILVFFLSACGAESSAADPKFEDAAVSEQTVRRVDETTLKLAKSSRDYIKVEELSAQVSSAALRAPARVDFKDGATAQISSPLEGRITKVHVREGQKVEANDPVLTVHSPEASSMRAEIARLQIPLKNAKAEVARQERLTERQVGVQSELLAAEMQLAEVEDELKRAREMAAFLGGGSGPSIVIRAPIAGTVLGLNARVGASIEPSSDGLVMIGDAGALRIVADVFERDLSLIEVGASVDVTLGSANKTLTGKVEHVGTLVDRSLRRAPVFISIEEESQAELRPGMFARVDIHAGNHEGLSVPTSAVLIKDHGHYVVYVETGELQFSATPVKVGPTIDGRVRVLSGLELGARVVTTGALLLDNSAEQLL